MTGTKVAWFCPPGSDLPLPHLAPVPLPQFSSIECVCPGGRGGGGGWMTSQGTALSLEAGHSEDQGEG